MWRSDVKVRIQKWGNSLALRIPKSFAEEAGLERETPVEMTVTDGKLVIAPAIRTKLTLEQLLAKITPENLHREVDTGARMGTETW